MYESEFCIAVVETRVIPALETWIEIPIRLWAHQRDASHRTIFWGCCIVDPNVSLAQVCQPRYILKNLLSRKMGSHLDQS